MFPESGDMDLKGERASIDNQTFEFGHQGIEAANKLQVLYLFEMSIHYTDAFKESLRSLTEDDGHWADFNELYESLVANGQAQEEPFHDSIAFMVHSLLRLHLARLRIEYDEEDFDLVALFLYSLYTFEWEMLLGKMTLDRNAWLPIVMVEGFMKGTAD